MIGSRCYNQYCGLARSLDLIGDRWSLLVVRELLPGPRRYRDLASGLGSVASNLLTQRLRSLEAGGVLERRLEPDGTVVYALTPWGEQLREPIEALVRWSTPLMATGPRPDDAFDIRWLAVALPGLLGPTRSGRVHELSLEVRGSVLAVRLDGAGATSDIEPTSAPTPMVSGEPDAILGLVVGALDIEHPAVTVSGSKRAVQAALRDARR